MRSCALTLDNNLPTMHLNTTLNVSSSRPQDDDLLDAFSLYSNLFDNPELKVPPRRCTSQPEIPSMPLIQNDTTLYHKSNSDLLPTKSSTRNVAEILGLELIRWSEKCQTSDVHDGDDFSIDSLKSYDSLKLTKQRLDKKATTTKATLLPSLPNVVKQ